MTTSTSTSIHTINIWVNYNISLTWILRPIWGWCSLLTMISRARENSEVVIIYPDRYYRYYIELYIVLYNINIIELFTQMNGTPQIIQVLGLSQPSSTGPTGLTWLPSFRLPFRNLAARPGFWGATVYSPKIEKWNPTWIGCNILLYYVWMQSQDRCSFTMYILL